ncbi:MAG: DUF1343 domain-containing protein [Tannerella sp.]|nr:DUF1343 domain-containing protein [Tannerella sp.]
MYGQEECPTVGAARIPALVSHLQGRRVGLAVNRTSVVGAQQVHLLDTLWSLGVHVTKIYAPEHGFRGTEEAGAVVADTRDAKTGIPVVSLYGNSRKPSAAQLHDVDVIVFDMQDVGTRFYTYISTMHYLMEACAAEGKKFVVADRPNPNDYVDGPVRRDGSRSFVGMHPIPVLHGLTVGELARMINGEGWLDAGGKTCDLTVVTITGWKHGDVYRLPVIPSPNLPNDLAVRLYPSLCFFEGTSVSVGRGTYFPFQALGYPDEKAGTFVFTPESLPGFDSNPLHRGKRCYGVDLRQTAFCGGLSLRFVIDFYERLGRDGKAFFTRPQWFDLLAGTDALRRQIVAGMTEDEIRASWQAELDGYKSMRKKYLLYDDNR